MAREAMNLTFGDLIIIEIAIVNYMKDLDMGMQSGQYISELLGKLEYQMAEIKQAQLTQLPPGLDPNKLDPNASK